MSEGCEGFAESIKVAHVYGSGSEASLIVAYSLGAPLCSGAKGGQVLVSRGTVDAIGAFTKVYPDLQLAKLKLQGAGTIDAKGIADPIKVYEAIS